MRKTSAKTKLSTFFIGFLILAGIFLLIGLGTLGSFSTVGQAYGLHYQTEAESQPPAIVFELSDIEEKVTDEEGMESIVRTELILKHVYLNIGAIYGDPGEYITMRLGRGYSAESSAFSNYVEGRIENFWYEAPAEGTEESAVETTPNALYNWVEPFEIPEKGWDLVSYPAYRIILPTSNSTTNYNVLINEIVFVGEKKNATESEAKKLYVIPAKIFDGETTVLPVTPVGGQSYDEAREAELERAGALLDAQELPSLAQSSFFRYSDSEILTLMSVREIRQGSAYDASNIGLYEGDRVYGPLGLDLVAFGTVIFGMSPFGLRFFPMLASFGVLMFGFFFVRNLFAKKGVKSDLAGFVFAALYALCNLSIGIGHLGTPLMIGVFFFTAALYFVHRFYKYGLKKDSLVSAAPLALSGFFGACAILTNGVWVVPVVGLVALFGLGMVRQQKARRYFLDKAIAEAETSEGKTVLSEDGTPVDAGKEKVAKVVREYRYKNALAPAVFGVFLLLGSLLLAALAGLPASFFYVKLYDDPSSPMLSVFALVWKAFVGGFNGVNVIGTQSGWQIFYEVFHGAGEIYAVTAIVVNAVAALAAIAGVVFALYRIVMVILKMGDLSELRSVLVPLAGVVLSLITAAIGDALGFVLLAYAFGFALFGGAVKYFLENAKLRLAGQIVCITGAALLILCFLVFAVFTFSIPLPDSFLVKIFS